MQNIWLNLSQPIFILAPMEDVTDTVFRQIIVQTGRPDLFFTEFTNVDGIFSAGQKKVMQRLQFTQIEKPVIAQIWGMKPENYYKAAELLSEMGFDGIDINMGCPEKSVVSKGACSGLINNRTLAKEIIDATMSGAKNLPVSVKTRIGFKEIQTKDWIGFLLEFNLAALTVHGRTTAEMSAVPAHWDEIGKVVTMRNARKIKTRIIGNGDIDSLDSAREKIKRYGVDGVMIGRGIFHNPWLFKEDLDVSKVTISDRLTLLKEHIELFEKTWEKEKNFQILKKYFKIYLSDFEGSHHLRIQFMETKTIQDARELVMSLLASRK